MTHTSTCPSAQQWQQLLLGQVSQAEAEVLESHLAECTLCLQVVRDIREVDTLAEEIRSRATPPERPMPESVRRLMDHLKGLRLSSQGTVPGGWTSPADAGEALDFLAPAQGPDEIGRLGAYRVLSVLGAGGMGVVFQAEDPQLKRTVALKVMRPALAASDTARKRFLREAQATAKLEHDHIVPIYQVDEDHGVPFLAMQLLKGQTLDDRLEREPRLPLAEVLRVGREVAEGLVAAHEAGLIHRDIKPGNIWLEEQRGRVKILDFGLARAVADDVHLTQTGAVAGTPAYMAPEQAQGEHVDARSDLFSLGCVLYRLATGTLPFRGSNSMSLLLALAQDQPAAPATLNADIPPALSDLVMKLLSKDPAARPASARVVVETLTAIERGIATEAPVVSALAARPRRPRRALAFAAALLVGLLAWGATFVFRTKDGTVTVTTTEADVKVVIDGEEKLTIDSSKFGTIVLKPGRHKLAVTRNGETVYEEDFVLESKEHRIHAKWEPKQAPTPVDPGVASLLDRLDHKQIPAADRFAWQPKELVAILGTHQQRHFGLLGHVNSTACSPDGKLIACGGNDGTVSLFETASLRRRAILGDGKLAPCFSLAFSPDGNSLVGGFNGALRRWDLTGAEPREQPTLRIAYPLALAYAPDGKTLAVGNRDGQIQLWEVTGAELKESALLKAHSQVVADLVFSADGKTLASVGRHDQTIRLWGMSTPEPKERMAIKTSEDPKEQNYAVALSPDGKTLALGDQRTTLRLWDIGGAAPRERVFPMRPLSPGAAQRLTFSPDGRRVAVGCYNGLALWDLTAEPRLKSWRPAFGVSSRVFFTPDGQSLVSAGQLGTVHRWDLSGEEPRERFPLQGPVGRTNNLAFLHGDRLLISGGFDGRGWSWDWTATPREFLLRRDYTLGFASVVSPDGKALAVRDGNGVAALFELHEGQPREWMQLEKSTALAFSPDGATLAQSIPDGPVRLWDVRGKKPRERAVLPNRETVEELTFSADGQRLAGYSFKEAILWDFSGPSPRVHPLSVKKTLIHSVAFHPGGQTLATGLKDGRLQLWDLSGSEPHEWFQLQGHESQVNHLAYAPDGSALASADASGRVIVWDASTRQKLREWNILGGVARMGFAGDSRHLALGLTSGPVYLVRLGPASTRPPALLTVTTPEPDVKVFVNGQEKLVVGAEKTGKVELPPGQHVLTVKDGNTELYRAAFALKAGGEVALNATWEPRAPKGVNPLDSLDPAQIPAEDRFAWQAKELVAILGTHAQRHLAQVSAVACSPDGKLLASAGADGVVCLWEAATMRRLAELGKYPGRYNCVAFSPDSKLLACGRYHREEATVRLWDLTGATPKERPGLKAHGLGKALVFSADGKTLATAGHDLVVRLWDMTGAEPREKAVLKGHTAYVASLAFSRDGKTLVSGSDDKTARVWDLGGAEPREQAVLRFSQRVLMVALTPDGKTLALCTPADENRKSLRLWDLSGPLPLERASYPDSTWSLVFSSDGKKLACGGGGIRLWDVGPELKPGPYLSTGVGHIQSLAFSSDDRTLVNACFPESTLQVWDLTGEKPTERFPARGILGASETLSFAAGTPLLVSSGVDGKVRSWDFSQPLGDKVVFATTRPVFPTLSPDGKLLAVRDASGQLTLLERVGTGWQEWWKVKDVTAAAFSADSNTLALSLTNGVIQRWDVRGKTPRQVLSLPAIGKQPQLLTCSPDGRHLACAVGNEVFLWNVSGKEPRKHAFPLKDMIPASLAFSPDGKTLIAGTDGGRLQMWDLGDAEPQASALLLGHEQRTSSLAFSPDGKRLASGDESGRVILWDATSWKRLRHHQWQVPHGVSSLAFAADSRHLAVGLPSGPIHVLRLAGPAPVPGK